LAEAREGGFVERTKEGYQFSHDKLQTSFQSMFDEQEKERLHLVIGETYLAIGGAEAMYSAAVHLQLAPEFARDKEQRIVLSKVNLEAAKYCKDSSAFGESANRLRRGLALLDPDNMWDTQYDLAFEMTELLAKMELIGGDLDTCKKLTAETLVRAKTLEMKINPLLMNMEVRMTANEMDGSIAAASQALSVLGLNMPRKVGVRHVVVKLLNVKRLLRRKTDADILSLPPMEDRAIEMSVQILLHLCTCKFRKIMCFRIRSLILDIETNTPPFQSQQIAFYRMQSTQLCTVLCWRPS
jgi:predicted ATPase